MTFVLIDLDGGTLEEFEASSGLRRFLRTALAHDPAYADDLAVLEYKDDRRVGPPASAHDFVAEPADLIARSVSMGNVIEVVTAGQLDPVGHPSIVVNHAHGLAGLAGPGAIRRRPGTLPLAGVS